MGEVKFTIISILGALPNVTRPIFTKTFVVTPKKNEKKGKIEEVSGILTITMEFGTDDKKLIGKHFGKPLKESLQIAKKENVVHLTEDLVMHLLSTGATSEGIIRIPGNRQQVIALRQLLDSGKEVPESEDPYDLAGVLKLYLSELPDSLIPEVVYIKITDLISEDNFSDPVIIAKVLQILKEIPKENMDVLECCCRYFVALCKNTETKMSPDNIGISIGPTICMSKALQENPAAFMFGTKTSALLLSFVVRNYETIFFGNN